MDNAMDKIKKSSELALIRAISDSVIDQLNDGGGRLMNRCKQLNAVIDDEFLKIGFLSDSEIKSCATMVDAFCEKTGWLNNEKHISTIVSFLLDMVENSEFGYNPKIIDLLNDMFDYYDRVGKTRMLCMVAGGIAGKKWRGINERNHYTNKSN